jgi:broad specificity phosphatase PhoE
MAVNRIFVVRHGETQANVSGIDAGPLDYPLTKKGKKDIRYLARLLSRTKISAVFSSPIFRTVETAKILATPHGLHIEIVDALTDAKLRAKFIGNKGRKHILTTPDAFEESYQELENRVVWAIAEINKKTLGNAIVVTHGDVIVALMHHIIERKIGKGNRHYVMHPDAGSLSIIEFDDRPTLILFNYHRRLLH